MGFDAFLRKVCWKLHFVKYEGMLGSLAMEVCRLVEGVVQL
jgi:hypothetical protein